MSSETTEKKRRFRVDVDIDTFGSHLFVEADDEDEAREIVEGMSVAEVIERVDIETEIKVDVEEVDEVDDEGRSLEALRRKAEREAAGETVAEEVEEDDDDDA